MICNKHEDIREILEALPKSNNDTHSNVCPGCAFELGYINGFSGEKVLSEQAIQSIHNTCKDDALKSKCVKSAYLLGFDIGSKVASKVLSCHAYNNDHSMLRVRKSKNDSNLITILPINSSFIIGVFGGRISEYDIIVKYWKYNKERNTWGLAKQPKHIHWVVDVMIKQEFNPTAIQTFIESLQKDWDNQKIKPIRSIEQRNAILNPERLFRESYIEEQKYCSNVPTRGEYSILFLIILAKLLMFQERTNLDRAFMFRNLLNKLLCRDFFGVISTATHNGR